MAFDYDLTDKLKFKIKKLVKKDKKKVEVINRKIKEIVQTEYNAIDSRYKNLRHEMSDRKRVHIDGPFVITFRVDKDKNFILFLDYDHHDRIYK
ncbi:MAG: hypothetical protein MSIBF_02810 [Candidatus Altiarchaeales archaeon IMC4]|nr:MAG: hypothetical protein MSIBF_02810 [Candidatus Altiarchaeales archaeon IMC4]